VRISDSEKLRAEISEWVMLSNGSPNYAMSCYASRVLAVDKNPGLHPLAYGEIWMRLFGKYCLAAETKDPARDACGIVQSCAGLQAGIEGNLRTIWPESAGWNSDSGTSARSPLISSSNS